MTASFLHSLLQAFLLSAFLARCQSASAGSAIAMIYGDLSGHQADWHDLREMVYHDDYVAATQLPWYKRVRILLCVARHRCQETNEDPCCVEGFKQYKHACYARCLLGEETCQPGKCREPVLAADEKLGARCGDQHSYCPAGNQCCPSTPKMDGPICCPVNSICCGDICCSAKQQCQFMKDEESGEDVATCVDKKPWYARSFNFHEYMG